MRPVIGIVSNNEMIDKGSYKKSVFDVNEDYLNLIYKFGGVPIIIPYMIDFNYLKKFLNQIDGLLLIGGEDVSPVCFKKNISPNPRDNFEIMIYKFFKENNKPIFGICRGLQIINVAEGGTLKNIKEKNIKHTLGSDGWINHHEIIISDNTKLSNLISSKIYTTSSVHHQAIDKLGNSLIASAFAKDGIIEAIEYEDDRFILAFQGHIEKCLDNFEEYNNVVKKFIKEARYGKK